MNISKEQCDAVVEYFGVGRTIQFLHPYQEFLKGVSNEDSKFHTDNTKSFKREYVEDYITDLQKIPVKIGDVLFKISEKLKTQENKEFEVLEEIMRLWIPFGNISLQSILEKQAEKELMEFLFTLIK